MTRKLISTIVALVVVVFSGTGAVADDGAAPDISVLGVGFNVVDLAASEKFYIDVFGLHRTFRFPPEGDLLEVGLARPGQTGATVILAHFNDDPLPEDKSAYGRLIFSTQDADAVAKRASDRGSTLRNVGTPGPANPVIIFLDDPDGYQIELYQAPAGQ
jgi:catechol 2,3-dioxygenase-like lactoylglutathione lyase family enzyme